MSDVLETLKKLPPFVYSTLDSEPCQVTQIKRGVMGYWIVGDFSTPAAATAYANQLNSKLDPVPTLAQIRAMEYGSCFGWEIPLADPDRWVERLDQLAKEAK